MPESPLDQKLGRILAYHDEPEGSEFVANVMQEVRRERLSRKFILWTFGLIGALFGLAGAFMLSDSITRLLMYPVSLPAMETMQVVLVIVATASFYVWFMNDELSIGS